MAHASGQNCYISFIYAYGTAVGVVAGTATLSGDQRSLDWDSKMKFADVTAGADTDESSIATTRSSSIKLSVLFENAATGSAVQRACADGNFGTLTWGPDGSAVGKPKYSCAAWVASFSEKVPYDKEIEFEVEFQKSGNWITNWGLLGSAW